MSDTPTQPPARIELPGKIPAQIALEQVIGSPSVVPEIEQRLYQLFRLIEDHVDPDDSGRYGLLLQSVAEDQTYDGVAYLGLMRAPNGTNHPIYSGEGGLVRDMLRQWEIWTLARDGRTIPGRDEKVLVEEWLSDPDVNNENILLAIIHESLARSWAHFVDASTPERFAVTLGEHDSDRMMEPGAKALMLLQHERILVDGQLIHLLLPNQDRFAGHWSNLAQAHAELELLSLLYPEIPAGN